MVCKIEGRKMKRSVRKQRGWLAVQAADGLPMTAAVDPAAAENGVEGQSPPSQTTQTGNFIARNEEQDASKLKTNIVELSRARCRTNACKQIWKWAGEP